MGSKWAVPRTCTCQQTMPLPRLQNVEVRQVGAFTQPFKDKDRDRDRDRLGPGPAM
jgi:hypothetical protein